MIKILTAEERHKAMKNFSEAVASDYFANHDEFVNALSEEEQWDLYWAIAEYTDAVWEYDLSYEEINNAIFDASYSYLGDNKNYQHIYDTYLKYAKED